MTLPCLQREHGSSFQELVRLELDVPVVLNPGERASLYVHSARPGDEAIVYDNLRKRVTYEDPFMQARRQQCAPSSHAWVRRCFPEGRT